VTAVCPPNWAMRPKSKRKGAAMQTFGASKFQTPPSICPISPRRSGFFWRREPPQYVGYYSNIRRSTHNHVRTCGQLTHEFGHMTLSAWAL